VRTGQWLRVGRLGPRVTQIGQLAVSKGQAIAHSQGAHLVTICTCFIRSIVTCAPDKTFGIPLAVMFSFLQPIKDRNQATPPKLLNEILQCIEKSPYTAGMDSEFSVRFLSFMRVYNFVCIVLHLQLYTCFSVLFTRCMMFRLTQF
jgi:hypothetical protein